MFAGTLAGSRLYRQADAAVVIDADASGSTSIAGNQIYSNATGIRAGARTGSHRIVNNVIYDQTAHGVQLDAANVDGGVTQLHNNTLHEGFESAAPAVHVMGNSRNVDVRNNIFSVGAAAALDIGAGSQVGLISDFNLFDLTTAGVGTGTAARFSGADFPTLTSRRAALGLDLSSLEADPQFVDADGADDILGANGVDNGQDDDFHLAIDRGKSLSVSPADRDFALRFDDPATANQGQTTYFERPGGPGVFDSPLTGVAENFRADNA